MKREQIIHDLERDADLAQVLGTAMVNYELLSEAAELLRRDSTHVIPFDELESYDMVYLEEKQRNPQKPFVEMALPRTSRWDLDRGNSCLYHASDERIYFEDALIIKNRYYGSLWRCWNKKPTAEEMIAEIWDDDPDGEDEKCRTDEWY